MSKNLSDTTPDDPVFTAVELQTLEKLNADTRAWIQLVTENQKKKSDHETAAFSVAEVETKIADLDREIKYLINKAKIHKPKPKPEKKEDKPKEGESAGGNATTTEEEKVAEKAADDGEKTIPPTPESAGEAKPAEEMPPPPLEEAPTEDSKSADDAAHKPDDEL